MSSYDAIRQQHVAYWAQIMPGQVGRLHMSRQQLRAERERRLRALLALAALRSPWHRSRLRDVDLATATEGDLARIPPMTTEDLMAHRDEIVTDPRLNLAAVDRHLASLTCDAYLLDGFHAVASGGSTGRRGVFVYGWNAWAAANAGFLRPMMWDREVSPEVAAAPSTAAMVAAQNPAHMTSALGQTFANPAIRLRSFPVTLPVTDIVAGLNAYQPTLLIGYPTALAVLADEARSGALRVSPLRIATTSEPLRPEIRRSLEHEFGAPVANMYGTSEAGPVAVGCWRGPGMHVCDDLVIVDPVDSAGRPVEPGVLSDKVYLTPLTKPRPAAAADRAQRPDHGDRHGMPLRFSAHHDRRRSGQDRGQLRRLGIAEPEVRITTVTDLDRLASGKVRSFIPLPANEAAQLAGRRPASPRHPRPSPLSGSPG